MNKREIVLQQIKLQEAMQGAGFNLVTCGNCGNILLHEIEAEQIECFCGVMDLSDCPDYWYTGMESNEEFN